MVLLFLPSMLISLTRFLGAGHLKVLRHVNRAVPFQWPACQATSRRCDRYGQVGAPWDPARVTMLANRLRDSRKGFQQIGRIVTLRVEPGNTQRGNRDARPIGGLVSPAAAPCSSRRDRRRWRSIRSSTELSRKNPPRRPFP